MGRFTTDLPRKTKPKETSCREYEVWLMTVLMYENAQYKSSIQYEFDSEIKMRDYVTQEYEFNRAWHRVLGENDFWKTEKKNKIVHTHTILLQKITKIENVTKILEEDDLMF